MFLLLFVLNVFAGVTDTCTAINCTMVMDYRDIPSGSFTGMSESVKSKAQSTQLDLDILVRDATLKELRQEKIRIGNESSDLSKKVLSLIRGHRSSVSKPNATIMRSKFSSVISHLRSDSPDDAETEVLNITADGNAKIQRLIDDVTAIFAE